MKFYYKLKKVNFVLGRTGAKGLIKTVWSSVLIRPLLGAYGYLRCRKKYPQHFIFVAGFAKGGSSWFAHMLSALPGFQEYTPARWPLEGHEDACGVYEGMVSEFKHKLAIVKGHTWGYASNVEQLRKQAAGKYIITIRDPRDCLISAYWFVRRRPGHWDYEKAMSMSLDEYITDKLESGEFKNRFVGWLDSWRQSVNEDVIFVRYEDLLVDAEKELRRVFKFLGFDISMSEISALVKKQSFENKSKRKPGQENTDSFLRKGIADEWKSEFSDYQKKLLQ